MTKRVRLLSILLILALLLAGCGVGQLFPGIGQLLPGMPDSTPTDSVDGVAFAEMGYIRPNMTRHDQVLEKSCETARSSDDLDAVVEAVYDYYDVYDRFYASYDLAYIFYCGDVTDTYWEQEYEYCAQNTATVDAGLDALYYALAESPVREALEGEDYFGAGFFDAYEGESVWDETFLAYMEEESALLDRYYEIAAASSQAEYYSETYFSVYGSQLAQVLVDLIALRQEMAAYLGYDSYPQFAYDWYHYRDYTPGQVEDYLYKVGEEMVPLYTAVINSDVWEPAGRSCTEQETFAYVKGCAQAMGGDIALAFDHMETYGLYDIAYGENKYDASFETYLLYYYEPFVFTCPYGVAADKLTFAHEFGHFVNDYLCGESYAGTDVVEIHSQGMEYLSLFYGEDSGALKNVKLADSLCVYVEQAAYALFEQKMYSLTGEDLTAENLQSLYQQIGTQFGFESLGFDSREFVDLSHIYIQPMYLASYVVSNDVAFQIYQLEADTPGAGLEIYQRCLYSEDSYLMTFVDTYGLESPFTPGRVETVRKSLEACLG